MVATPLPIPQPRSRPTRRHRGRPEAPERTPDLLPLPRWTAQTADTAQSRAFAAGAAAFALDAVLRGEPDWRGCWRLRLALRAAVTAARLTRLGADEASLRDALHLTRPGDDPGPAGRLHLLLRDWMARPLRLAGETERAIADAIGGERGGGDVRALLEADRAFAARLGWAQALPLHLLAGRTRLAPPVTGASSGGADEADRMGVLLTGLRLAHAEAVTLARRAAALKLAAGSLRTRDDGRGVALVLGDDAVAPWHMTGPDGLGSDRAARRFCDSLHRLGALRLMTDRPTFRLYGL